MRNNFQQRGFTLIELLVVIVILGILSTISVGTFRSYFAKARDSERVSTVQNLAMMIKVDSGGEGDCGVYNYIGGNKTSDVGADPCPTAAYGDLSTLLLNNDYGMPEAKNGLDYYYGYKVGATEGDNDFFVIIGAEEDSPQNGKPVKNDTGAGVANAFAFIDGTTKGIEAFTKMGAAVTPNCYIPDGLKPVCTAASGWDVFEINSDGEIVS